MQVGLSLPQFGPTATREHVLRCARAADAAGFDSLWAADHVVVPREFRSPYPYAADGINSTIYPPDVMLEALTLLTFVAGATERIQLGTSVLVLPMRQPVLLAKVLATLDHLSGGRLTLGVGVGWCEEEFEVLSAPYDRRGRRTDEALRLLRAFWSEDWVDFEGEFYRVDGWTCRPRPAGTIPFWFGGDTRPQMERAVRFGDGWMAAPRSPLEKTMRDWDRVRELADQAGRDPASITLHAGGAGFLTAGELGRLAEEMHKLAEAGVGHTTVRVDPAHIDRTPELIAEFGAEHLPALKA